jgi:putative Mg2+ transporter-C (MgtC) family protein
MAEWSLLLRVLLAAGLSAAIGIEREFHGRPAGLRTHLLVGVGASLVVVAFHAAWGAADSTGSTQLLPPETARIAAGVITGIGFLGAGTIIKVGSWVRGLTTAASLWFVAAVGLAAGLGSWPIAVGGAVIGLAILAIVDPLASSIPSRIYQTLTLRVDGVRQKHVQGEIEACCLRARMRATLVDWDWNSARQDVTLTYRIRHRGTPDLQALAEHVAGLEGVVEVAIEL